MLISINIYYVVSSFKHLWEPIMLKKLKKGSDSLKAIPIPCLGPRFWSCIMFLLSSAGSQYTVLSSSALEGRRVPVKKKKIKKKRMALGRKSFIRFPFQSHVLIAYSPTWWQRQHRDFLSCHSKHLATRKRSKIPFPIDHFTANLSSRVLEIYSFCNVKIYFRDLRQTFFL